MRFSVFTFIVVNLLAVHTYLWKVLAKQQVSCIQTDGSSSIELKPMQTIVDRSLEGDEMMLYREGMYDFYGTINIGTNRQIFKVFFDTSCSMLWVPSINCTYYLHCLTHRRYNRDLSPSYQEHEKYLTKITLNCFGREVKGYSSIDHIILNKMPQTKQTFLEAEIFKDDFALGAPEGIFGLGTKNSVVSSTLEDLMKTVRNEVFYFKLRFSGAWFESGSFNFGEKAPHSEFLGALLYADICNACDYWEVETESVIVRRKESSSFVICEGCTVYPNPATRFIWIPSGSFRRFIDFIGAEEVASKGDYSVKDCDLDQLPDISFKINDKYLNVGPSYYAKFRANTAECVLLLKENREEFKWILGSSFLEAFYVLFDYGQKRVGFAPWVKVDPK